MIPPYTYAAARMAEERRKDALREGEHARLKRVATPIKRGAVHRLLVTVERWLAPVGEHLEAWDASVGTHLGQSAQGTRR